MSRAILFDLDGTLVDSERESAEAMVRALARHGVICDTADRDYIVGRSWVDIYRQLRSRYAAISWTLADLIEHTAHEREQIFAASGMPLLPGARAAIQRLAAQFSLAIVTGSSRREAKAALDALGLADQFRCVIAAEDIHTSKPDPGGYLEAARRISADIRRCIVVEDSFAGIAAGVAAGAHVVAVKAGNFGGQDQSAAHTSLETLDDLTLELVARCLGR